MVILSSKATTELFKNNDMSFVECAVTATSRAHNFHELFVALAPYGLYWHLMRRLMTRNMLVGKRVSKTTPLRQKCINNMSFWIEGEARKKARNREAVDHVQGVHLARFVFLMVFNLLANLMLSRDLVDLNKEDRSKFFAVMERIMEWSGHANMSDFFPWLRWADPQGLRRKMERAYGKGLWDCF
ncbi:Cytochrome P450 76A2 [Morus notabilis]|uniref:Cytochrome P450 76A2 n=1 Tax=Morus notabilis TaxID=981085 RepID=W9SL89_9ROSA|nr:Cytochrome P450 76A2 [Morus notabilis]